MSLSLTKYISAERCANAPKKSIHSLTKIRKRIRSSFFFFSLSFSFPFTGSNDRDGQTNSGERQTGSEKDDHLELFAVQAGIRSEGGESEVKGTDRRYDSSVMKKDPCAGFSFESPSHVFLMKRQNVSLQQAISPFISFPPSISSFISLLDFSPLF